MNNKVKYYREELGMTLAELSRKTGISIAEINHIENETNKGRFSHRAALSFVN